MSKCDLSRLVELKVALLEVKGKLLDLVAAHHQAVEYERAQGKVMCVHREWEPGVFDASCGVMVQRMVLQGQVTHCPHCRRPVFLAPVEP